VGLFEGTATRHLRLFRGIAETIVDHFGDRIVKGYLTTLYTVHGR
jgi:hypothetical protein